MHISYLFILVCILISLTNALFNETNAVKSIGSTSELAQAYLNTEFLTAFLFYCDNSRSKVFEPIFIEFAETSKDYYRFVAVDCDSIEKDANSEIVPACQEEFRRSLPQILFIEPFEERPDPSSQKIPAPKHHNYEGEASVEELTTFAKKIMPTFATRLVSLNDLEKFMSVQPYLNKVLFLSNKKSLPQYWKALTAEYRDRLSFGQAFSGGSQIFEKYGISKFPAIIIMKKNELEWQDTFYRGDLDYNSLKKFLKKFAGPKKKGAPLKVNVERTQAGAEDDSRIRIDISNISPENFEDIVYGTERLVLIHMFTKNDLHQTFIDLYGKFHPIIDIYNLNCTEAAAKKFSEETLQAKSLPAYRLYPIGNKETKAKSKIIFTKSKKLKEIDQEISDVIEDPLLRIDARKINLYQQNVNVTKKPALILFHEKDEVSLSLRVLAQLEPYKSNILFASFRSPSEGIKKQYSVDSLPKIVVVFVSQPDRKDLEINDGILTGKFSGNFTYPEIRRFLNTFLPARVSSLELSQKIPQVDNMREFYSFCQNHMIGCVIAILDGYVGNDYAEKRVKNDLQIFENTKNGVKQSDLIFVWVDGGCHPEFLELFYISDEPLPALVYYHDTNKIYARLPPIYDIKGINAFFEELGEGDETKVRKFSETPKITGRVCGVEHQKRDPKKLASLSPNLSAGKNQPGSPPGDNQTPNRASDEL